MTSRRVGIGLTIPLAMLAIMTALLFAQESWIFADADPNIDESNSRTLEFAGYQWIVKSGCDLGPGPNCWSDSEQSVWIENGQLHLKIREIDGVWHSSEVYTTACTQYGKHRFFIVGRPDNFDKNIVTGLFLYKDDNTEIDIEFAEWGEENPTYNAQYVVQPWDKAGNREPFPMNLSGDHSTHYIDWSASAIQFRSIHGHYQEPPDEAHLIHEWQYTGEDIPAEEECMKIHVNFWLHQGNSPSDGEEAEITVKNANFPDPATPATETPTATATATATATPTATGTRVYHNYLPRVQKQPSLTPIPTPWITVTATGNQALGKVGPSSFCNVNYKIALYVKTDIWYLQPVTTEPGRNVQINSDCTWASSVNAWDQVAAHLVSASYIQPSTINSMLSCPPPPLDPGANPDVLAVGCYP